MWEAVTLTVYFSLLPTENHLWGQRFLWPMGSYVQTGLGSCRSSGWGNACRTLPSLNWGSAQKLASRPRVWILQRHGLESSVNTKRKVSIIPNRVSLGSLVPKKLRKNIIGIPSPPCSWDLGSTKRSVGNWWLDCFYTTNHLQVQRTLPRLWPSTPSEVANTGISKWW